MRTASRLSSVRASRALNYFLAPVLLGSATLLGACGDGTGSNDGTGGSGAGGGTGGNTVTLTQDNNFKATSTLAVTKVDVAPGQDITLDWSMLTKDIQNHSLNPAMDINQVTLVPAAGTPEQVQQWLATGQLTSGRIASSGTFGFNPAAGTTSARLSQFTATGSTVAFKLDSFKAQDGVTYLVTFATGARLGYGSRTMVFLNPLTGNTTQNVVVTNDTTKLTYTADLHDLKQPTFDPTTSPTFDWSAITKDGQDIDVGDVTSILLGFYKDRTIPQLEMGFLNLQESSESTGGPTRSWQLGINGVTRANFAGAPGRAQEGPFVNFSTTDTGIWLMGMFCSNCQNPAPVIVTILDPK
jgi:hypothetical protein